MSRLRIGVVSHAGVGGSGVVASQVAALFADAGHDVHVFATATPPRGTIANLTLHRVEPPDYPVFDAPPYTLAMASKLADGIDALGLDVVHVHYALPYAVSAALAVQMAERTPRLVVTLHGTDVTGVGAADAYAPALRHALRSADVITTPSHALAAEAVQRGLVPEAPVRVPNFVDPDQFSPDGPVALPPGPPRFVHVSNFRPVKRTAWLVEALVQARATATLSGAELVAVGNGPDRDLLIASAREAGVADAVRLAGVVDDPAPWLRSAQVFALPSAEESFGLSALEAMSCGVPVVACALGGLTEVVDATTGILTDDDRDAFVGGVVALLGDADDARSRAVAARDAAVRTFSPARARHAYERLYRPA